ncbi:SH3 domain-containing protein PJ696.02, partial [Durusdinium trenchii]
PGPDDGLTYQGFEDAVATTDAAAEDAFDFKYDSAKPWYMFGRATVDKTGGGGGPAWEPDSARTQCHSCGRTFDFFHRRSHCRYDGRLNCRACCSNFRLLPPSFGVREPQRVCNKCCEILDPMQDRLAATMSNSTRTLSPKPGAGAGQPSLISFSMSAEIQKACAAVDNFFAAGNTQNVIKDQYIPAMLLRMAKGVAFLQVWKMGFMFSARVASGIVVGRDRQGSWTAPSAIGLAGLGWGAQLGGEVSDFVIILNTESAVDAFSGKGQVSLGSQLSLAAGPLGRTGEASINVSDVGFAPCYTYSQTKGLFFGVSLEGAIIKERADVNDRFYGKHFDPKDILAGRVAPPKAAEPLYEALQRACSVDADSSRATETGVTSTNSLMQDI